jgi:hypothetical protein
MSRRARDWLVCSRRLGKRTGRSRLRERNDTDMIDQRELTSHNAGQW